MKTTMINPCQVLSATTGARREAGSVSDGAGAPESALRSFRRYLSVEEHFVARLAALRGACDGAARELTAQWAREAGVEEVLIRRTLEAPEELPTSLERLQAYAVAVAAGEAPGAEETAYLRARLGEEGLREVALNVVPGGSQPGAGASSRTLVPKF